VARSTVEEYMVDKAKGKLVINHVVFSAIDDKRPAYGGKANDLDAILQYGARCLFEEDAGGCWCELEPLHAPQPM